MHMKAFLSGGLLLSASLLLSTGYHPAPANEGSITVEVTNLRNASGSVLLSLYNSATHFPGNADQAVQISQASIHNGKAVAVFEKVAFGTYAVAVLHDENGNLQMDTNFMGLPTEGYGVSNDARGVLGPPKYSDAAFQFKDLSKSIRINVVY
jgi:uncharacterized protein (DUF2141 family)